MGLILYFCADIDWAFALTVGVFFADRNGGTL